MKVLIIALCAFTNIASFSQSNTEYPKLSIELGVGYEYASLKSFNETHITPIGYGRFLDGLNSGWSANLRAPLKFSSAIELAVSMNYRQFRLNDETTFDYTSQDPYYTQRNNVKVFGFEGGLQSTVYLDQLWEANKESLLNVGVFGSASFVFSKYRTFIFREGDGSWATFTSERLPHWNASFGAAIKYNFRDSYFNSIVLNTGFNYATAGQEYDVDLNGFFTRVLIGLGR